MLAVARAIAPHGWIPTVATHRAFAPLVENAGIAFAELPGDLESAFATEAGVRYMAAGRNTLRWASAFNAILASFWTSMLDAFVTHSANADAIVVSSLSRPAALAAAARGIPWVGAYLGPNYPSRSFAHRLAPQLDFDPYRRLTHKLVPLLLLPRSASAAETKKWLSRHGFPAKPSAPAATIFGFSERVVPAPEPRHGVVTGYWFLDADDSWTPPDEVTRFLAAAGPPVVAVSLSSIRVDAAREARLVDALDGGAEDAGVRLLVLGGWTAFERWRRGRDGRVLVTGPMPHDRVFPRVAAVVHHGGAGSAAAAARAGVPSVVVPFCADQFFWADRLRRLGVAPASLSARRLARGPVANALRIATSPAMRDAAHALGEAIAIEGGAERAARIVADACAQSSASTTSPAA